MIPHNNSRSLFFSRVLAVQSLLVMMLVNPAQAGTGLNGTDARPFYIFGHNPNTLEEAESAILAGANALEPDVQLFDCLGNNDVLIVYHDDPCTFPQGTTRPVLSLDAYLEGIHNLAITYPQLAMVVFDVKSAAASAAHGDRIINSIRQHLNYGPVSLNVMISIGTQADRAIFDHILSWNLGAREGVQIDAENDAGAIVNFFFARNYFGNIGYGDGTAGPGPNLPRSMDGAAWLRASIGYPKMVTYVYTLGNESSMHSFIAGGTDGIIPDGFPPPLVLDPSYISELVGVVNAHPEIRVATRDDNPFVPLNEAYGLQIRTADDEDDGLFGGGEGTDACLTFTLTGCRGSASVTVNAGHINPLYDTDRMEAGGTDYVTLPSFNLGKLTSITIHNDGTGLGPDWKLLDIQINSATWLAPDWARSYTVSFDNWINDGDTTTLNLTQNFPDPAPTIKCPADMIVPNAPDQCAAVVTFSPQADALCPGAIAVCSPASGASFPVGTATVTCHAESGALRSPDCTFAVTVQDIQKPVIACPSDLTFPNDPGQCSALVNFVVTAADNCPGVAVVCLPPSASVFLKGATAVNCTATDPSGNSASCGFQVTVIDNEPPRIVCPTNEIVEFTSISGAAVDYPPPAVTDNCPGATAACVPPPGSTFALGTNTVHCLATDTSGNTASCDFTIVVLGPLGVKLNVLADLKALRATVADGKDGQALDLAIAKLAQSVNLSLWIDQTHLELKHGQSVIDDERETVHGLLGLIQSTKSSIPDSTLQGFIDRIVKSDRLLALIAINDATAAGVNPKKIALAWKKMDKGDGDASQGNFDQAIGNYRDAWMQARHAVLNNLHLLAGGPVQLEILGFAGETYVIQTSTDLAGWETLATPTAGPDGVVSYEHSNPPASPIRFYRLLAP